MTVFNLPAQLGLQAIQRNVGHLKDTGEGERAVLHGQLRLAALFIEFKRAGQTLKTGRAHLGVLSLGLDG